VEIILLFSLFLFSSTNSVSAVRSFTSYSAKIAQSLYLLHDNFMSSIETCNSDVTKEKIVKVVYQIYLLHLVIVFRKR